MIEATYVQEKKSRAAHPSFPNCPQQCPLRFGDARKYLVPLSLRSSGEDGGWAGDGIVCNCRVIDVDQDSGISGGIGAREQHSCSSWIFGSATSYIDLIATQIELCTTDSHCDVECYDFGADEIVSWHEIGRNGEGSFATVGVESLRPPCAVRGRKTILGHFEPFTTPVGSFSIGDPRHINDDGSIVIATDGLSSTVSVSWLLMHFHCDCLTSWNSTDSRHTGGSVDIASDVV